MLATVLHRTAGYTGGMVLGDGTVLAFVNGQAGPTTITYADAQALTVMGYSVVTSDTPLPGYDLFTDQLVAPVVASATSATTAALANSATLKAAFGSSLTPTATKTATYAATAGDLAMMNVAAGGATLTLPTAPANKAVVGYRAIGATAAVPLTVNCGGSTDTIGTTGAISATVALADEVVILQYDAPNTRWLAVANVKTQASLDVSYARPGAASTRLRAVGLGDSTVAGGMRDPNNIVVQVGNSYTFPHPGLIGEEWAGPQSWFNTACLRSGGRLLAMHNAGVASDNTAGCLARFDTDVTAWSPDVLLASFGVHNDISGSVAVATTRANVVAMIRKARAAGIEPILVTCYPENNVTIAPQIRKHNAWLKNLAAGRDATYPDISHLMVVDPYAAVVDPTSSTGAWVAAYTADGTHASPAGAVVAGDKILADMAGLLRGNTTAGPYAATDNVQGSPNLFTNGLMLADINADGKADNWTGNGAGTTFTIVSDSAVIGKAEQAVVASSTASFYQQLTVDGTIIKVGDRLKWAGWAKATANAGSLNWNLLFNFPGVTPYQVEPMSQVVGVDYGWFYFECEAVVPATATILRAGIYSYAGTGTLWLAQQSLVNMSTGLTY